MTDSPREPRTPVVGAALDGRFRELYAREFDYVWHSLRRLGLPPRELEDATHDVFLVVHQRLDQYDPTRPLRPWLFGIAFRVAADERRRARRSELQADPPELPDAAAGPEQQAVTRALVITNPAAKPTADWRLGGTGRRLGATGRRLGATNRGLGHRATTAATSRRLGAAEIETVARHQAC